MIAVITGTSANASDTPCPPRCWRQCAILSSLDRDDQPRRWPARSLTRARVLAGICAAPETKPGTSMPLPRSIFTGRFPTIPIDRTPEHRRLSTPEYLESLRSLPPGPKPPTPPAHLSTALFPRPTWTPKLPFDPGDPARRPLFAPLQAAGGSGTPLAIAGTKRPVPPTTDSTHPASPTSQPLHKRRRLQGRPRRSLDHFNLSRSAHFQDGSQPPSPLFFSSRNSRPHLPARFSSSEAAARMLSKTREEGGIKTVNLARGTFSGLSPPAPASAASGRTSERSSLPRTASPDTRERSDPLRLLGSVGIVELLEQDGRPTFIVDIGALANYTPESSSLHILFANSALRSNSSIWELIAGNPPDASTDDVNAQATNQFRAWLLGAVNQGEMVDVSSSPVEYGGIVWSWYTLRKRLRIISGAMPSRAAISLPSIDPSVEFALPSVSSAGLVSGNTSDTFSSSTPIRDQQDYFGSSVPVVAQVEPKPPTTRTQNHAIRTRDQPSDGGSGSAQKSPVPALPYIGDSPSFNNECVLRAHSAGDVDSFHREPDHRPPQDHDMGFFDWTRLNLSSSLPRHIQFARSVDWASTPLGPIEYWSNDLRAMCNLIM